MNDETKTRIQNLVQELDALVPRTEAVVVMKQYGGGPDESQITGTTTGYLRLGIEFLKGPLLPPRIDGKEAQIDVDLDYLLSEQSDVNFDYFRLDETLRPDEPASGQYKQAWKDRAISTACGIFCLLLLYVIIIGLITIGRWIFK